MILRSPYTLEKINKIWSRPMQSNHGEIDVVCIFRLQNSTYNIVIVV